MNVDYSIVGTTMTLHQLLRILLNTLLAFKQFTVNLTSPTSKPLPDPPMTILWILILATYSTQQFITAGDHGSANEDALDP